MGGIIVAGSYVIGTVPEFLTFWQEVKNKPVDDQIEAWVTQYMSRWPELLAMQKEDYVNQGET